MKNNGILKTIRTTVLKCDTPTITGRVYPLDLIKKSLKNDEVLQEKLATKTCFGELGCPMDRTEVDLTKASHRVISLYKRDDGLYADIEILDTPNGRLLEKTIKNSSGAFRTGGIGNIDPRDDGYVDITDYTLHTINYTDDPA